MNYTGTIINGVSLFKFNSFIDERGLFSTTYNRDELNNNIGHNINFIQDNESYSKKNVIRGLHYQRGLYAQSKLIRCTFGIIQDIIVDLRNASPTFGKYMSVNLTFENLLYIPRYCAHGFLTLTDYAIVHYKVDNFYKPDEETGIRFDDANISVDWNVEPNEVIISEKDATLPAFDRNLIYF